jgi:hypothetical protein
MALSGRWYARSLTTAGETIIKIIPAIAMMMVHGYDGRRYGGGGY